MSADGTFGKRHVGEGDLIYMEGDPGTETFLIQSGRVELVRRASDGLFETIATLGPGQVFGELALASDAPRKEGARALADCLLIAVKRDRIEASLYSADPFVAALYRILAGNLEAISARKAKADRAGEPPAKGGASASDIEALTKVEN